MTATAVVPSQRTPAGAPVFHSFPIHYFAPGTRRADEPNAGPKVRTPLIATSPLVRQRRR